MRHQMKLSPNSLLICALLAGSVPASALYVEPARSEALAVQQINDASNHFSRLSQVNTDSVSKLGLAWSLDLSGEHTLESTPIEVDGVLYFSGQRSSVYAVNAATGALIWYFDPEVWKPDSTRLRYIMSINRGVAFWKGAVYVGTIDGRLIALDAKTGKTLWSVETVDARSKRTISGAPRVFDGKVVIGNGGADYGERGYVTAYDARSGKQLWRFFTAPGSPAENADDPVMKIAAGTWDGDYWNRGTGGAVWNSMTFDPEMHRLYIGTGNASPYNPAVRSPGNGDNLFTDSIVALDARTGKYIWHYQVNPRDAWDYDATNDIELTKLAINGKRRRVLVQAPKNGFFYVIDRDSGKLISAEKFGKATWAERIDVVSGRPVEAPNIRRERGPVTVWPSPYGVHNWQPMSLNPMTRLVYIPSIQLGGRFAENPNSILGGTEMSMVVADDQDAKGKLVAWDPVQQRSRWSVPLESLWNGGVLSTAGNLVFQGVEDGSFIAYDARDGRKLWSFAAGLGIIAAPMSYSVGDVQYVSVLVGWGGATGLLSNYLKSGWKYGAQPRRLLTFTLGGKASLPLTPPRDFTLHVLDDAKLAMDESAAARGEGLYASKNCVICHGFGAVSAGSPTPDLRESQIAFHGETLGALLRSNALAPNGMPQYSELTDADAGDLYMYIRSRARLYNTGPQATSR
jgi:quinohemoprotein ethanol dehydrogenase